MNRSEINRALAKILAYIGCGKLDEAKKWQAELNRLINQAINQ